MAPCEAMGFLLKLQGSEWFLGIYFYSRCEEVKVLHKILHANAQDLYVSSKCV